MGLDFFKRVVELQQKHGRRGAVVSNGLQTNATLIDDAFAEHLGRYRFLVGVSLDGPRETHDHYRRYGSGRATFDDVMRGIACLKRRDVAFNILTLVGDHNVGKAAEIYRFLRDQGFLHHQYIPCVEFDESGRLMPFAVRGAAWGEFLCAVFDEWVREDTRRVSVRLFDSVLAWLVDKVRNVCHMGRNCCQYFVVEHNGDVYPCDFFVEEHLKLGNVRQDSWDGLVREPRYVAFGRQKAQWNPACSECEFLACCGGDCLKNRFYGRPDPRQLSVLCEGWKMFFAHALPGLKDLARQIVEERRAAAIASQDASGAAARRVGRNAPCPCGSGKKFKNCCMR